MEETQQRKKARVDAAPPPPPPPSLALAAAAPQLLPFRVRWTPDDTPPSAAMPLEFVAWPESVSAACDSVAVRKQHDPGLASEHAPELWKCDADGNPLPDGKVELRATALLGWTATMTPRPPALEQLLQRNTSTGAPGAFVLFTLPPATAQAPAAQAAPVTSATDPDVAALVAFLRSKYPERAERSCPIKTAGSAFEVRGRAAAVNALAEHLDSRFALYEQGAADDQRLHKVAVAAAGPGTGKTRLMWEALRLLQEHNSRVDAANLQTAAVSELLARGVRLFTTYGNSSGPLNDELALDAVVGGVAARLLHVHFCPDAVLDEFAGVLSQQCFKIDRSTLFRQLTLRTALRVIADDILTAAPPPPPASKYQFMVVALDEFTYLNNELLQRVAVAFRVEMNRPSSLADGRRIFIQPVLGGTSMSAATSSLSLSGMLALPLAVPPLGVDDVLAILRKPGILPQAQLPLLQDQGFLELVADISGHPRSLDYLAMRVRALGNAPAPGTAADLRAVLAADLRGLYRLIPEMDRRSLTETIRIAILGDEVVSTDYADAESRGLVLRMEDKAGATRLHVPLMFLEVWRLVWRTHPMFASVQHLFSGGLRLQLASVDTWQHFEVEVFRMEALRLACTTGTRRPLADLLRGALGDVESVAGWKTTVDLDDRLIVLPSRLPFRASVQQLYADISPANSDRAALRLSTPATPSVDARRILMGLNADGAPFDQFSSRIEDKHHSQAMLCLQSKHTCMLDGDKLTLAQVKAEYAKISEAMKDAGLRAHFGCAEPHLPFAVLLHTVKPLAPDVTAEALPPRCFVVGRQQFGEYFGSIFGARIEMVARATGVPYNITCTG